MAYTSAMGDDPGMAGVTCPACHASNPRPHPVGRPVNGFAIGRCARCRFVFAFPRPTEGELATFYDAAYFEEGTEFGYGGYSGLPETNAKLMWPALRHSLGERLPRTGRLLDVGCASGGFLAAAAEDGWEAVGTEMSASAADRARAASGVTVFDGVLLPPSGTAPFDLVTAWHVLEHVLDPLGSLVELRKFLAPGGILFVELPSWNSLGRRVRRSSWAQLKPPEHLNYFTPRTLRTCLGEAGYEVSTSRGVTPWQPLRLMPTRDRWKELPKNVLKKGAGLIGCGAFARAVSVRGTT
jgi:SAM-dependent methyltransferase